MPKRKEPHTTILHDLLIKISLSPDEALVYELMLNEGEKTAGYVIKELGLKRGHVYNLLNNLVERGLIEEFQKNNIAHFRPRHPSRLMDVVQERSGELRALHGALEDALPGVVSRFNLINQRPVVHYFEGLDGIKKVLQDSLSTKEIIYSYGDLEAIHKFIPQINAAYVKKREELKIKKRGIVLDTPFAREFLKDYHPSITDTKLIKHNAPPFGSIMQIYDGKISYITLSDKKLMGVIIEDEHIYTMHKYLFEYTWKYAENLRP